MRLDERYDKDFIYVEIWRMYEHEFIEFKNQIKI